MNLKNKKNFLIFLVIILFIILMRLTGIQNYLTLKNFVANREHLLVMVNDNYMLSLAIYFLVYILIVISTLPIAGLLTVLGGFLYGVMPGTAYAVIAGTIGCIFSFLIFRYLLGKRVQDKYGNKLENFNKNIEHYGALYILMLQLAGIVPFFIINILASLTKLPLHKFVWATFIGVIPINLIYAYAGRQLGKINALSQIFSPNVIFAIVLLMLLSLIPIIIKRLKLSRF